ncbi:NAD(P)+ transhydrogenase beta chain [Rhizobium leguminosarum]
MEKPSYRTSKQQLWFNSAMAWLVIMILAGGAVAGSAQAVSFGTIAVPALLTLIAAMLGIHRHFGTKDMRIMSQSREGM